MLAILYLQGALAPDCALVHFAAAGEMAQVGAASTSASLLRCAALCCPCAVPPPLVWLGRKAARRRAVWRREGGGRRHADWLVDG